MTRQNPTPSVQVNPALLLDNQLCFALYSTSLAMTKLYKPLLEALALTYPQYLVMLVLWEQDDVSVSALGERLFLDSGTLTPLLKRMEAADLLVRTRSSLDERRVHLSLSAAGRKLQARATKVPACLASTVKFSLPELTTLTKKIQALRRRLVA
jgi:DNA-binding MarR family transcriptional regulator